MSLYLNDARVVWTDEGILLPGPTDDDHRVVTPMDGDTWAVVGLPNPSAALFDPDRGGRLRRFPTADEAIFAVIGLPS